MDFHVPSLYITSIRPICRIRAKRHCPKLDLSFPREYLPTELIHLTIHAIKYKATTPEEQYLGHFTGRNMNILCT